MKIIEGLKYSNDHEWVREDSGKAYIGITDYAQHALGGIVYTDLPTVGTELKQQGILGAVESVKAASDILSPVSGTVVEVNEAVVDAPELINEDAFENWLVCIEMSNPGELGQLMDASAYEEFCGKEA